MKMLKFKMVTARTVAAGCLLGLLMAAQSAVACTVGNWSGNFGGVNAAGPDTGLVRYSGLCAMQTPDATAAWVQDNSPGGIDRIRARFYVLNNLDPSQGVQLYRGFSSTDGNGPLFTVTMTTAGQIVLRDNVVNQTVTQTASTDWLSVEIDWQQGSGDGVISLSVNGQTADVNSSLNNDSGAVLRSVRLGNLNGAGGTLNFDAYESRRMTAVGRLCEGDALLDSVRDFADINEIFVEFATGGSNPAEGNPDFNSDGLVDFADINEVFVLIATGQGACPNA